jgi:hypothetical protein
VSYFGNRPKVSEEIPEDQFEQLIGWLQEKSEACPVDLISRAFTSLMDMFCFKSEQLEMLFDMFDSVTWKSEVYLKGISRIHDYRNFDFVKRKIEFPDAVRTIYMRFGILNLFNPHRPNGSYRLDLAIYEEKIVCKMLLDLAKQEGLA